MPRRFDLFLVVHLANPGRGRAFVPEAFQKDHFVGFHGNRAFLRAMVMLRTFPAPKGIIGIDFKNEMTAHGVLFGSALSCDCQSGVWTGIGSSPQSFCTNGWKEFPGGLIMQWGWSGWACVTFPRPFPMQVFNIGSQYSGTHHEQGVASVTLNGFCPTTNMMTSSFYWIAWGR